MNLVEVLKNGACVCFYPSAGKDLSDVDFFGSGMSLWEERKQGVRPADAPPPSIEPDVFVHTDVNFYMEFAAGLDLEADECGIQGGFEILEYQELPQLQQPNRIHENFGFSGKCFAYKLRVWGSERVLTLLFCLCENEFVVADLFLAHGITVPVVWSKNWNGGRTYGTWMINAFERLDTKKVYTDWLSVPGFRGQPANRFVKEHYPALMQEPAVKMVRNTAIHWIDEGAHGWVEEFNVVPKTK